MRAWRTINDGLGRRYHYYFEAADNGIYEDEHGQLNNIMPPGNKPYAEGAVRKHLSTPRGSGPQLRVVRTELGYGEFYHRIWRGEEDPPAWDAHTQELITSVQSAQIVFDWAREIFRVVQPDKHNRRAYGMEIRQLLLTACTEIESTWKALLVAHQVNLLANITQQPTILA